MEIRNVDDCFRFRLLRRIAPDRNKSDKSFEIARSKLAKAERAFEAGLFDSAVIGTYTAMFHAARALLYRDGIQEKSHFAVFVFLKEKYSKKIHPGIINLLNIHRTERHEAMYGLEYEPEKQDAETAIKDARLFIAEAEKAYRD